MDSFDGLFLEEAPSEKNINVALSESGTGLDSSVGSTLSTSICQISDESVRCQDELDRIF